MSRIIAALLVLAMMAGGCSSGEPGANSLTFMAGFRPQANLPFVAVYVAQEEGFFAEENLDVTIQHSAGGGEHLQLLSAGAVDVTTQDAAVLLQRRADPGLPLVSIALLGQVGQQAYAALANSGIESPADWEGRVVGFKGTPAPDMFAILEANGLTAEDVELVNVGFDPRILTEGRVDVYPIFKSNEPNLLADMGFDINTWEAAEYGSPTLGLALVTSEDRISKKHTELAAFVRAAIRGVQFAMENPEAAIEATMKYVGEDGDASHQRFILETEISDAVSDVTDEFGIGYQTEEQWQALSDFLGEHGALEGELTVSDAFTNEFLP